MRIGELARQTGTSVRSLRHYERQGLLTARRAANGYREFDQTAPALVREIRALLAVGFTLAEVGPFVDCVRAGITPRGACPGSTAAYQAKLAELDADLRQLHRLRDRLTADLADVQQLAADAGCRCGDCAPPPPPAQTRPGSPERPPDAPAPHAAATRR